MSSSSLQGFKVLPLRFSSSSTSCHNLFIKEHSIRSIEDSKPAGKTLFVINVPPYATENSLKVSFSKAGRVRSVIFQSDDNEKVTNDGFKRSYVVFEKRESLLKAMKLDAINSLSTDEVPLKVGLEKWIEDYNSSICDPEELQKEINLYISNYDKEEEKKKKGDKELVNDEGWTVVTKKGRNPGISRKESVEHKLKEKDQALSEKKQLKNFYTFQIRDSKKEHIAALRKSFEEAKNKINLMKKARRFKPY
ncbi:ribosomal RNA-processing protein 7 homolog A [Anoplophora glabripennis]|uniref:ribosomal RNA-processing protein 7 homolog A n=1 Tax=Anoplophora glabripennis TaxID=217634 RepID=UPI0008750A8A|nr:ribosomal RNA-processing protein 7 homolog A [Anoplophora glabripennis]